MPATSTRLLCECPAGLAEAPLVVIIWQPAVKIVDAEDRL